MKQSKILTSALLIVLPFFLTACTLKELPVIGKYLPDINLPFGQSKDSFPQTEITLNVWGLWENSEVVDALIKKYNERRPNVKITYEDRSVLKPSDYKESIYTRLSQENSTAGDVVFVHNSWVAGIKDNLDPVPAKTMSLDKYQSEFYPVVSQSAVFSGNAYAMPLYYDGLVLVYNKKHFSEINQTEPPTSWEEFRRLALELTVRGPENTLIRGGAAMGTFSNIEFASDILGLFFSQAGVNIPTDLDQKPAADAVTFYMNFVTADKVWNDTLPEASVAFTQEKASMIFIPAWHLLDILAAKPEWATSGQIGVAPVPQVLADSPASWGSFWMAAVPSKSANKAAAWDFIQFLTEQETQKLWFEEASKFRPYGPAYSSKNLKQDLAGNQYLSPLLQQADFAKSSILATRSGNKTANDSLGLLFTNMFTNRKADINVELKAFKEKLSTTH